MIKSAIRSAIRRQTVLNTSDISDADINAIIDEGYNAVASSWRWPFYLTSALISTTAATTEYNLPTTVGSIVTVFDTDKKGILKAIDFVEYIVREGGDPTTGDRAYFYYIRHDGTQWKIGLSPRPTAIEANAYTVWFHKKPTLMATDGDSPEWDDQFDHILVEYGCYKVWEREEYFEQSELAYGRFERLLGKMYDFYRSVEAEYPMILNDGWATMRPWLGSLDRLHYPFQ